MKTYSKPRQTTPWKWSSLDSGVEAILNGLGQGELPWPLLLYGPAGTTKTTSAKCFLDRVPGMFCDCQVFFELPECAYAERQAWRQRARDKDTFCIVIDDIGKSRNGCTDYEGKGLQRLLEDRVYSHNHAGIYITNIDGATEQEFITNLAAYYGSTYASVVSRLTCGTRFRLAGRDRRQDARKDV